MGIAFGSSDSKVWRLWEDEAPAEPRYTYDIHPPRGSAGASPSRKTSRCRQFVLLCSVALCLCCRDGLAKDIYVDNLVGNDIYDGSLEHPTDAGTGPLRTLHRAVQKAGFGDRIVLTRTGAMYYDSLSLTGRRHSGTPLFPFTIIGNGATLSGLRTVTPAGWRQAGPDLWKLSLTRKGFYRLLRDGRPLPESRPEDKANPFAKLAKGEWIAWQGSVYFRSDGENPANEPFTYAAEQTGLSLHQVENVRIVDLTLRDFRFDGIHAQNMCKGVRLENVTCIENGRAGIAVSGSAHVEITGGKVADNGRSQVLISNPATALLTDVAMEGEPTVNP